MAWKKRTLSENQQSLYNNQTPAEQALEPLIAALGRRYRCQHCFYGLRIIPDFMLPDDGLIIEVDDESHNTKAKKLKDAEKTAKLVKLGWVVVRCKNAETIVNPGEVLKRMLIEAKLEHLIKE